MNESALRTVFCHFERREKSNNTNKKQKISRRYAPRNDKETFLEWINDIILRLKIIQFRFNNSIRHYAGSFKFIHICKNRALRPKKRSNSGKRTAETTPRRSVRRSDKVRKPES